MAGEPQAPTLEADGLLADVLEAHGGAERWAEVDEVVLRARSGGFALASKGRGRDVARYEARISTREPRTTFVEWPRAGQRGVYTPQRVWIETDGGEVVAERTDPRASFHGLRTLRWDRLHLLHFAGYALWGYLNQPFLLARPGVEVTEAGPRTLAATFPADLPVHSREQLFHLDDELRIRRNDYTAEVFGGWAKARHYSDEHRELGGFVFPTRRRVYPRQAPVRFPTLVWIDVDGVDPVRRAPAP